MAFKKYASLEQACVLDLKGSATKARTASLEKIGEFRDYRTEDGYLYARIRAISSRVNKNNDGWPSVELAGGPEIFDKHSRTSGFSLTAAEGDNSYGFSTFLGKPIFVDHNNSNPQRARGVIVDSKLHVEDHKTASELDSYYSDAPDNHMPPTWVELLLEVDAKSFPKLAKAIIAGSKDPKKGIDGFSMGCDVERSVCNICKNSASSPEDFCKHVKLKGAEFDALDKHGHKVSKKSYEDCYGIKFFEISAVFDPADETALLKEVRAAVVQVPCPSCGQPAQFSDVNRTGLCQACGHTFQNPVQTPAPVAPGMQSVPIRPGYAKTAENALPQSDLMTMPEDVDTLREEEVCPVCGSTMEGGHQCDVCGYVPPPEGLDNPDLEKAKQPDDLSQLFQQEQPTALGQPPVPTQVEQDPNNMQPVASVTSDMGWQIYHHKLGGTINPNERPIKPGNLPATNEPQETIISDQDKPVTNRTAASMIEAVNQENTMSNERVAADAPTQDTKADKRVDVNGVGGVMDGSNEQASKPDVDTNVEGKGGVIQDSNQEASKAQSTESLPTAGDGSDDSGFNKDKTTDDSGPTKTFDNSNEPGSAVTQKAFPTAAQKQAWGDERPFPDGEDALGESGGAKGGAQPADPIGKADDRVDLLKQVSVGNPQKGTDQWTGTGGNGVTKQQDPVTNVVDPNIDVQKMTSVVELFKIADTEVELGIIEKEDKYDRIAELEQASPEEIAATSKTLARVKTAGLSRRTAATQQGGVGRVPSMQPTSSRTASVERDESLFW